MVARLMILFCLLSVGQSFAESTTKTIDKFYGVAQGSVEVEFEVEDGFAYGYLTIATHAEEEGATICLNIKETIALQKLLEKGWRGKTGVRKGETKTFGSVAHYKSEISVTADSESRSMIVVSISDQEGQGIVALDKMRHDRLQRSLKKLVATFQSGK